MLAKAIVIIDDEADLANLFKEALQMNGLNVCAFTDPLEALNHIENNRELYSLVISDYRMPGMSGHELCTKLININPKFKIILMSAFNYIEHDTTKFKLIGKPIPLSLLFKIVEENLGEPIGKLQREPTSRKTEEPIT